MKKYKFIDLFCGIGGFRYSLEKFNCECVFSSEIEKNACNIYYKNFNEHPKGDITKINVKDIPKHDIICGGFPCQSFSICGKKKGFNDERGNLFNEVIRIAEHHKPKLILLENVKNILTMNDGNIIKVIKEEFDKIGYKIYYKVLNSVYFGVPQCRERTYFVIYSKNIDIDYIFPENDTNNIQNIKNILDNDIDENLYINDNLKIKKIDIKKNQKNYKPCKIGIINKGRQGERIYSIEYPGITICSSSGGIGSKTGLYNVNNKIRKLSVNECRKMFGFPENFKYNNEITSTLQSKFGNSVVINVLCKIFSNIVKLNIL